MRWAGVDVGGKRKGFHLALIESRHGTPHLCLLAQITGDKAAKGVYNLLAEFGSKAVAVDSTASRPSGQDPESVGADALEALTVQRSECRQLPHVVSRVCLGVCVLKGPLLPLAPQEKEDDYLGEAQGAAARNAPISSSLAICFAR
jgi:hypothetical protein